MSTDAPISQNIRLDDHTAGVKTPDSTDNTGEDPESQSDTSRNKADKRPSIHRPRAESIRKELVRRKYARFQESRYDEEEEQQEDEASGSGAENFKNGRHGSLSSKLRREAHRTSSLRHKLRLAPKKTRKKEKDKEYAVDILYENQRGWFFCGIPLYSSKSLLNFDPAAWQTGEFHDSPVNITNAQVPDPTWTWAWPAWYVDMSRDVDEEGWEYSFGFRQGFAWHGAAPWFSSFVRRRRWLRKRIRTAHSHWKHDALHDAHHLNPDYFTIHASADAEADSSRESSRERRTTGRGTSTLAFRDTRLDESDSDAPDELDGITDVNSLLRHLKRTTIDRKKLDAFQHFIADGGPELYYLADAMPEVIALFMYQHSRRQVVEALQSALRSATDSQVSSAPGTAPLPSTPASGSASPTAATDGSSNGGGGGSEQPFPEVAGRAAYLQRSIDAIAAHVHALDFSTPLASPRSPRSPRSPWSTRSGRVSHKGTTSIDAGLKDFRKADTAQGSDEAVDATETVANINTDNNDVNDANNATEEDGGDDDDDGFPAPHATGTTDAQLPASPTRAADGRAIKGIPASAHVGGEVGLAARMDLAGREEIDRAAAGPVQAALRQAEAREELD